MPEIRRRGVGTFQELEERLARGYRPPNSVIREDEFLKFLAVESAVGADGRSGVARRLWVCIGVKGWLAEAGPRPETAAADLVRVGFARHLVGDTGRSRVRRRRTAGKTSDCHIEASPKEMHRARLAEKV